MQIVVGRKNNMDTVVISAQQQFAFASSCTLKIRYKSICTDGIFQYSCTFLDTANLLDTVAVAENDNLHLICLHSHLFTE